MLPIPFSLRPMRGEASCLVKLPLWLVDSSSGRARRRAAASQERGGDLGPDG